MPESLSLSAISLKDFASSLFGVAGTIIGAMYPPFVPQSLFFWIFAFLLSTFCNFFFNFLNWTQGKITDTFYLTNHKIKTFKNYGMYIQN